MEEVTCTDRVRNEKFYKESRRRGISYLQKKGRLTGLVTSFVGTAF
jgi:hypothetical protein